MSSRRKMLGDQVLGPRQKNIDYPSLMVLFNTVDFIGISSYAALAPDFDMYELQNAAFQFFQVGLGLEGGGADLTRCDVSIID